jgi:hypothetical protein
MTTYICTLKYGKKYSSDNVNKLYDSIQKTCSNFKFICLTDDVSNLNLNIQTIMLNENPELKKHWNKLRFFDPSFIGASIEDDVIIMDIDQKFIGNPKQLIEYSVNHGEVCFAARWWTNQKYGCPVSGGLIKFKSDGSQKYVLDIFLQNPNYWLTYYHIASISGKYPENIQMYSGEQNYLYHHFKKTHKLITWPKEYVVKLDDDRIFMEKQKILYSNRVGGELIVNGKFNSKSILVTFAGKNNDIFGSDLI